ncbi:MULTISPECIES: helix-turn-helix transcriptional regulator [Stutzerimonas]|jgi:DNA-binding NarL/FixJ family response regulator|uniref:helix-turn-helix transcriptional regulator n=1 Tax=Stutzerimonas TaxID=2901164 RepID=UPI0007B7C286|nr:MULTISPECIES: response regulator transcription factor [Stutzerimonas]MAL90114.1 DNA-binding response regulator [Pseudomonas sp.]MCD1639429.1 response regulator transcription factor [Stutzerimonas stutzeri]AWT09516.1 DNA-binding response regulator [Stutzerimonas frequens]KZX64883.1 helix-turn-helix transcriptional regulator [Stutzerimonas frequens]MBA4727808.1 response regulator transcription factor [Pseudomonas sp.]|tara:strand:+ start:1299 stop:1949 length:651 start_codon:yes stop_codon:yes gene_type:complete
MKDDAVPAIQAARSCVLLLSTSDLLDGALRQHLQDCPGCTLRHVRAPVNDSSDISLMLLDVASYNRDECLRLLRQFGDVPVALINAQADQARQLIETHPWIRGVFYRATPRSIFVRGIETMLAGGDWLPRELMEKLLYRYRQLSSTSQAIDELTLREKQILALAGQGLSNAAIGERLHLSIHTIKSHVHNALRKLGASNRAQGASLVLAHVGEAAS